MLAPSISISCRVSARASARTAPELESNRAMQAGTSCWRAWVAAGPRSMRACRAVCAAATACLPFLLAMPATSCRTTCSPASASIICTSTSCTLGALRGVAKALLTSVCSHAPNRQPCAKVIAPGFMRTQAGLPGSTAQTQAAQAGTHLGARRG